jgi:hypothetical protein
MLASSGRRLILAANGHLAVMLRKHLKFPLLISVQGEYEFAFEPFPDYLPNYHHIEYCKS